MRKTLFSLLAGGLLGLLVWPAAAEPRAGEDRSLGAAEREVLRLMDAGRRVNFAGKQLVTLVFGRRRAQASVAVWQYDGWLRTEVLSPGPMKGRVVLERGRHRFEKRAGDTEWQPRPGGAPPSPWRMLRNYKVRVVGSAPIAGLPTTILEVKNRRTDTLARKFWVDKTKGVVLRTEVYNWAGLLMSSVEFQEIDYGARLCKSDFEVPEALLAPPPPDGLPEDAPEVPRPRYVPEGYVLAGPPSGVRTDRGAAVHFRYSDGLNAISVFVRKLKPGEPRPPHWGRFPGPFSGAVQRVKGDYRVTVIGDLDPAELARMAESAAPEGR
ncbi:MAG: sigma-E factor regulatory protein RseB domain-containing protein [Armatimonadota bacterium]|jgi:hypothetical protein|nr:sigma-E factor regulatory protein RseB domain-containing protein [Armatimonadota bacterium]